jgi:hypothetical protein
MKTGKTCQFENHHFQKLNAPTICLLFVVIVTMDFGQMYLILNAFGHHLKKEEMLALIPE